MPQVQNTDREEQARAYDHADEALAQIRRARSNLLAAVRLHPQSQEHLERVWRRLCEVDGLLCFELDRMADEYVGGPDDGTDEDDVDL